MSSPYAGTIQVILPLAADPSALTGVRSRRLLDTGSPYDVAFSADRDTYLWVAVFNHTQTRHSQHLHPVRVTLE